jgi:lipid-A-disaccharide synthase
MRALKAEAPGVRFAGVGGRMMAAEGLVSQFDTGELSVMGIAEVLPRLPRLLRRIRQTVGDVVVRDPDALITIDSPGFSLRVARRVRARAPGIRTIHYVAPSVWAWRPARARHMARFIDHVLALLPFEPLWMTQAGMSCDFVGHPVAARPAPSPDEVAALRARVGAGEGRPLLLLAPGSRVGEVRRMMPVFADVAGRLAAAHRGLRLVVPVAETVEARVAAAAAGVSPAPLLVGPEEGEAAKLAAFAAADVALVTSGTVVLEMAAAGVPMVSAYRTSGLTAAVVRRLLTVDSANLVNLVHGTNVVPEFLQEHCTAARIAPAVERLLSDRRARAGQTQVFGGVMAALGRGGEAPSARAARSVLRVLGRA